MARRDRIMARIPSATPALGRSVGSTNDGFQSRRGPRTVGSRPGASHWEGGLCPDRERVLRWHPRAPNLALVMLPILPAGNHPWQTCPVNPYYLPCRDIPPPRHVW